MKNEVRVFGMHKAGTSFLMKALSHFCHRNDITLASTPFGMMPLAAYDQCYGEMDRKAVMKFLSKDPSLPKRLQAFSKPDFKKLEVVDDRLKKAKIISIGDKTNQKRVSFYRNSSVPVWELNRDAPALRIIRNPLSIVKSAYFSHLKTHSTVGWDRLAKQREILSSVSKSKGLWKTYEFMREDIFYHCTEGPLKTLESWPKDLKELQTARMEDMTTAPSSFLLRLWNMLGGEMDSLKFVPPEILTFEHQSGGRKPGEVDGNNHMRSGDPEEWRKLLPKDLIQQIRKDYAPLLEAYYPSSMEDKSSNSSFSIPPKQTLKELETVYTELMESRKLIATAEAANINLDGRLTKILDQRDKSTVKLQKRFEDMKGQRDKALKDLQAAKSHKPKTSVVDESLVLQLKNERNSARKALANMEKQINGEADALRAKLKDMTAQRDMALGNQDTLRTMRDEALGAYKTMMQFRDDALLAAQAKQTQLQTVAESRFQEMKGQRDKILTESTARFNDIKAQRDKSLENQTAMKTERDKALSAQTSARAAQTKATSEATARFEDMKTQRDKALAATTGGASGEAYKKLETQLSSMKNQRDKALEAQTAMKASRDTSLADAAKRFEDMKAQRDKAIKTATGGALSEAYKKLEAQFNDMKTQRDKALAAPRGNKADESKDKIIARLEDMKGQRDKAIEKRAALKTRFEDMKAQRDKLIGNRP